MPLPVRVSVVRLVLLFLLSANSVPTLAQSSPPATGFAAPTAPAKVPPLDLLRYDPQTQGPLVWVVPEGMGTIPAAALDKMREILGGKTPAQFAEKFQMRTATQGNLAAIIPLSQMAIATDPPLPDPFVGMERGDCFSLLLSRFTPAQWQQACSAEGLGQDALTEEQQSLLAQLLPAKNAVLRTYSVTPLPTGGERVGPELSREPVPTEQLRLRLSRRVTFTFRGLGQQMNYLSRADSAAERQRQADGSLLQRNLEVPPASPPNASTEAAFGVPLFYPVPNHLKPGQLPLDSPALDVPILLEGSSETLGDLLQRIAARTRFDLVADKRLARMAVLCRVAPGGQRVRASDLLKTLCRCVTGTFRRLDPPGGPPLFLLTDDVEGVGTRLARLNRWAEAAERKRQKAVNEAIARCAVQDPLSHLGFAPGDPLALSPEQLRQVDTAYREKTWSDGIAVTPNSLAPALRKAMDTRIDEWKRMTPPILLQTDSVTLGTELRCDWVLPDGSSLSAEGGMELPYHFLQQVAGGAPKRPTPETTTPPKAISATVKRRVLLLPLPQTDEEVKTLLTQARKKGFTELWLRVPRGDAATVRRFRTLIAQNPKSAPRLGVVIPWLWKGETGIDDRNILGETGETLAAHWFEINGRDDPEWEPYYRTVYLPRFQGWKLGDPTLDAERVLPFARIPGLACLVLENTAAPGWAGWGQYGDNTSSDMRFGYALPTRLACVRGEGFDPVDVRSGYGALRISPDLPYLPDSGMEKALAEFRARQNRALLAAVYDRLHGSAPQLPLYLQDNGDTGNYPFYVRWEAPERLPGLPTEPWNENAIHAAATAASPDALLTFRGSTAKYEREHFAERWNVSLKVVNRWSGFVYDVLADAPEDRNTLLAPLPDVPSAK